MRHFRKLALTATAIVTLATSVFANIYEGQLISYSDQQVLNYLVSEYAQDPSTFEDAHAYIILNRPDILEEYLSQTLGWAPNTRRFSFLEPSAGETSGMGSMIVLGVVGTAAAISLADNGGGESPGPNPSPEPIDPPDPVDPPDPIDPPDPVDPPDPIDPIDPVDPGPGPDDPAYYRTEEFNRNYALSLIGADKKYAQGWRGQGVKIAILDTGIDLDSPEFANLPGVDNKIDFDNSHSYFVGDPNDISEPNGHGRSGHGTHVANIAAGRKDGQGLHGVAFDSELVIFKGIARGLNPRFTIQARNIWADAIHRSIDAGAHVMNNSWGRTKIVDDFIVELPISDFTSHSSEENRAALQDFLGSRTINALNAAKDADLMFVFAAGNSGLPEVGVTAGIPVVLPEYNGHFIAVVAVREDKSLWHSSNHCGVAQDFCLAAPGTGVIIIPDGNGFANVSGTSIAAPYVTGAYAVLKSQWPDLTAPVIAQIMFAAAEDLGEPGVDPIYGHGLLNLSRAMLPAGELVVYQGNSIESDAMPLAETGIVASGALAPALNQALAGQVLMVADAYTRGFELAASALVSEFEAPEPRPTFVREVKASDTLTIMRSDHGTGLRVDGEVSSYEISLGDIDPRADPFGQLLTEDYAFGHDFQLTDALALTTDHAVGSSTDTFSRASLGLEAKDRDGSGFSAQFGRIEEHGTVLGSRFMGAAGQDGHSNTSFLEISGSVAFGRGTLLTASGTQSRTDFQQEGLVTGGANLMGHAGEVSISQAHFLGSPGTIRLSVSSPLQISSGEISIDLPQDRVAAVAGQDSTGVTRTSQTVDIIPSERPIDIGLTYQIASDTPGPDILLNAGYRAQGGDPNPYIGFALSHSF